MAELVSTAAVMSLHEVAPLPQYRRIHIEDVDEFPLVYRLLESYIEHPELASSVKEIVFRPWDWGLNCFYNGAFKEPVEIWDITEAKRDVSQEKLLYRAVKKLDLSGEHEEKWVKSLTWMKPEVVEQRKDLVESLGYNTRLQGFNEEQSIEFAHHATAMLLTLCPNIERIVYSDAFPDNPVKETLKRINYGLLPNRHLQKLKDVVILGTEDASWDDGRFYMSTDILDLLSMFHRLPNIESVSAEAMDNPRSEYRETFPPASSNIKCINLTHSDFHSQTIAALIRAPKSLERLTVTTGGRGTWDMSSAPMFAKEVGKALHCQKHSLVRLDLDLGWSAEPHPKDTVESPLDDKQIPMMTWDEFHGIQHRINLVSRQETVDKKDTEGSIRTMDLPDDRPYGVNGETIGSLHDFDKLTHLSLGIQQLRHYLPPVWRDSGTAIPPPFKIIDALPPNLQYLLIRGYEKGAQQSADEEIAELLRFKSTRFPMLREIHGIDETIPQGETLRRPDDQPDLIWKVKRVDQGWLEHRHDEL